MGVVAFVLGGAMSAAGQTYEVSWWTVDAGGAQGQTGGLFLVDGTAGQPDAGGPFPGGGFSAHSGFWSVAGGASGTAADLAIAISDAPDPVAAGATLTYTVQVTNLGPGTSPAMSVQSTLPAAVTFVSSQPGPPTCVHLKGDVHCTFGSLTASAGVTVTIQAVVATSAAGTLTSTALVTGGSPDPVLANNVDDEATLVAARARGELAHGATLRADLAALPGPAADEDRYRLKQQPWASYEIVLDEASGDLGAASGPALERLAPDGVTILQSAAATGTGISRSLRWENDSSDAILDQVIRVRSLACGTDCGADDTYRLRTYETTARVPRFNNGGGQVTLLLLQNASTNAVSGRIHFWSVAGTLLVRWPIALSPRQPFVLNTAGVPGLAAAGGSITVSHDGRYGDLAGKTVALEPTTGLSFDSPLEVRPR
jgi:uncharacterized repeat protein (TIGR01451 family)